MLEGPGVLFDSAGMIGVDVSGFGSGILTSSETDVQKALARLS